MRSRRFVGPVAALAAMLVGCGDDGRELLGPPPTGLDLVAEVAIPPNYGIHDTFVRDGIAFVCAWNTGVIILDVGNGLAGGHPGAPVEISRLLTAASGVPGARVHNAWWFHNPNSGERRYLFLGQEGPGQLGVTSTGDIHVVDVSDLRRPVEVAGYHMNGTPEPAGTHNFWMDEAGEILYAAYYNGGIVSLDVSGTLEGDLADREIARIRPAGDGTYVWGVHVQNGSVYATDMLHGFFQLPVAGAAMSLGFGGDGAHTERFTSDLWVHGAHAYTGTWGTRGAQVGNVINVWRLDASGRPAFARAVEIDGIGTVADLEVSADGTTLLVSGERGPRAGVHLLDVRDPERPVAVTRVPIASGVHTGTLADIDGRRFAFLAKNPPQPALLIFEIEQ